MHFNLFFFKKKRKGFPLLSGLKEKIVAFLSTSARNIRQSLKIFVNCTPKIIIFSK
tara:strand:- start:19550 stop:19717 length:168 start_codon:yes stop_codon:yes gene_type:complete